MMYLSRSDEPVGLYINSVGGDVNAGLVIYDLVQSRKNDVRIQPGESPVFTRLNSPCEERVAESTDFCPKYNICRTGL